MQKPRTVGFELAMLSILLLIAAPVFAQYGPPEDDPPPGGNSPPEKGNGVTHDVTVSSNIFTPSSLTINPGDTVRPAS